MTVSPLSGARDATPGTQISFLGAPAAALKVLSVVGSRSGRHGGRLRAYSQGDGASFVADHPFLEGERVTVRAELLGAGAPPRAIVDGFRIARQDPLTTTPEALHQGSPADVQHFHSRPALQPPVLTVTASSPASAPGDLFAAPYSGPGQAGPMILDASGGLVWFKGLPRYTSVADFRVQEYLGQPVLTWWQGDISVHGFGRGQDVIADASYTDIAHVRAGNGAAADLHDFQLTPAGTALITAYEPILCNLSPVGGPAYGGLTDGVMQEIDVKTGLVMYEWTSLDHVALSESYARVAGSSTATPFDFFHVNSIDPAPDGSLVVSARNTWAVYDIDPRSGQILWRLGGKRSSFTAGAGTQTAWQHDPRVLPGGLISLFDNGASPTVHHQSRGLVLSVDPQTHAASLVSQFTHTPPLISESQGNLQALADGDWFVCWGQIADLSEFSATGQLLFDAHFPAGEQSYRAFRLPWSATPSHPPALAFVSSGAPGGTVYASWNGATLLARWRVLAGPAAAALQPVAEVPRAGFETAIALPAESNPGAGASGGARAAGGGRYLQAQALDAAGQMIGSSAVLAAP